MNNNINEEILNKNINEDIKSIISSNIIKYRKMNGLTQLELAEMLNYSDKSLSKWERGESLPDIVTLKQLADIFGVTIDDLLGQEQTKTKKVKKGKKPLQRRQIVCVNLLSIGLVWLVAVLTFILLSMFLKNTKGVWLAYIYAVLASSIVLLVFSSIWGSNLLRFFNSTLLIWSAALSIHLTMMCLGLKNGYMWYYLACVLEVLAFVFFISLKKNKK